MGSIMVLSWASPIGLGIFFAGLGVFLWGLTKTGWLGDK